MFCPVKAIGKTVATERRMERDMKYITKNLDFQLDKRSVVTLGKFDGIHRGHQKLVEKILEQKEKGLQTVLFSLGIGRLKYHHQIRFIPAFRFHTGNKHLLFKRGVRNIVKSNRKNFREKLRRIYPG